MTEVLNQEVEQIAMDTLKQNFEKEKQLSRLQKTRLFLSSEEGKAKLLELYQQNLSTYAIAEAVGVSQCAAKKHLNKILGCFTEEQQKRQKYKSKEFRIEVVKAFQKYNNISKLSKMFDISSTTIRKILKEEGLVLVKLEETIKPVEQVVDEVKTKIEEIAKRNVTFAKPTNVYKKEVTVKPTVTITQPQITRTQPKYSLANVEQTQHAIITYVTNAMKECKCGNYEIQEYQNECRSGDFAYLLETSQEYIDQCNRC